MFARGIVEMSVFTDATNVDFQRRVKKINISHSELKYEKKHFIKRGRERRAWYTTNSSGVSCQCVSGQVRGSSGDRGFYL